MTNSDRDEFERIWFGITGVIPEDIITGEWYTGTENAFKLWQAAIAYKDAQVMGEK